MRRLPDKQTSEQTHRPIATEIALLPGSVVKCKAPQTDHTLSCIILQWPFFMEHCERVLYLRGREVTRKTKMLIMFL